MKKIFLLFISPVLALIFMLVACGTKDNEGCTPKTETGPTPLNLTVYLDLSNRLVVTPDQQQKGYSQKDRDLAIVDQLVKEFVSHSKDTFQLPYSQDIFEVIAYPVPSDSNINTLLEKLKTDCPSYKEKYQARSKRLLTMEDSIHNTLNTIYDRTIAEQQWPGADIWGFFSNGAARTRCVRKGYRNVLVVITDGYIYHKNNRIDRGNAHSYILNSTLADSTASLIAQGKGLGDLEVLFMELERPAAHPEYRDRMHKIIGDWLGAMGVTRYELVDTDVPANLTPYIKKFLE